MRIALRIALYCFALVAFVIPLAILRNGFRILVIGLLCVNVGPQMIHSLIHRRGGPLFFMLSLIPFFLDGVAGSSSLNQADGIHPTGEGYRLIVEKVFPVLEPLLKRSR